MSTQIQENKTKQLTARDLLTNKKFHHQMSEILPVHLTPDRMARVAIAAMTRTPDLALCTSESLFRCMMDLSQIGLEPDGRLAHLIPFRNRKKGTHECTLIIDYKGFVTLALEANPGSSIHSDVVCKNDKFVFNMGSITEHSINFDGDRGEMYAVYCVITNKNGTKKTEVMTLADVEKIRRASPSKDSDAWRNHYNEMAKKTVFRRAVKWVSLRSKDRPEVSRIAAAISIEDAGFSQKLESDNGPKTLSDVATDVEDRQNAK